MLFVAVHESAIGTKRTWRGLLSMSAFGGKVDMALCGANVRYNDFLPAQIAAMTEKHASKNNISSTIPSGMASPILFVTVI